MDEIEMKDITKAIHDILYNNFAVVSSTGCWLYTGEIDSSTGYGRVMIDGVRYNTHRLSAAYHLGLDLDDDKQFACHTCASRTCWNPSHLYVGDNRNNQLDQVNDTCKKGHALIGDNVVLRQRVNGEFYRNCRICRNAQALRAYHRSKKPLIEFPKKASNG